MRDRALELKVGLFVLAALAVFAAFIVVLGNFSLTKGVRLYVDFSFTGHLHAGAPVKIAGIQAGRVDDIRYMGGARDPATGRRVYVRVTAWLEKPYLDSIYQNAEFFINTQGVLGEQYLEIVPGDDTEGGVQPGQILQGISPPRTDLILARLYTFLDGVTRLLSEDRQTISDLLRATARAITTVDHLLRDNGTEIHALLVHLDGLTTEATTLISDLHTGLGDPKRIARLLHHLERTTAAIHKEINTLLGKANRVLNGAAIIADGIGPADQQKVAQALDKLLQLADKAYAMAAHADGILAQLAQGEGTAGALLVKDELYDDVREMVRDLKRNPWKFLWRE